ncbi:7be38bf1-81df-4e12-8870-4d17138c426b [Sclerotinia trifoliorum]|uniref:7be38bf1-81df-4e12-8870-4d17138c426b n=1 Tax=Sclerotinia trifoliorum TaxID=28548 RepID=A0A8H2W0M3_9HELO|nr:7be38bf1-81df-4e12-8870-4d17138c426b [Sclerotinia trifoliorum]
MTLGSMSNLETSQPDESKTSSIPFASPSGSSSPESNTSISPLSSASFVRSLKDRVVPPTLVDLSDEVVLQKFVKMTPTMKIMGKGKGLEVTTFTRYEAFPILVDTSIPSKEFEFDITQTNETPVAMLIRSPGSAGSGSHTTQGKRPKLKAYKPFTTLGYKGGHKFKQIKKENDDIFEDAPVEPKSRTEVYAEFNTAPSSPARRLSISDKHDMDADKHDMDGSYDDKPEFSPGTTIQDFGALPDHLRGPCFEVSPRTSVLDGPTIIPNIDNILSMNRADTSLESSLMRPLEAVPEALTSPEVVGNCMEQSDGPAPIPAIVPDVGVDSPVGELPVDPIVKENKDAKRTHKTIKKVRSGIRKGRYRCLRTPILVVILGKELSKPTKIAIENIASGLPSGLGEVEPLSK